VAVHGLAGDVIERIRDAIAFGELQQGQSLNERDLAAALGVSRGPVREALRKLHDERLVEIRPNRAAIVRRLSDQDIEEVYGLRLLLEQYAIQRAAIHATPADIEGLLGALEAIDGASRQGTPHDIAVADAAFHDCIYRAAHHDRLEDVWARLRAQVYVFFLQIPSDITDQYRTFAFAEHQELLDAIRGRDADQATIAVERHLRAAYERLRA
jgi:DNA-binding GntR family transcriptional regulator